MHSARRSLSDYCPAAVAIVIEMSRPSPSDTVESEPTMDKGREVRAILSPEDVEDDVLRPRVAREWRDRWSHCFVAAVGGIEAGLILFDFYRETLDGSIQQVFVLDRFRKLRIATELMECAEAELKKLGATRARLNPYALGRERGDPDTPTLIRWYSSLGFIADETTITMTKVL